MDIQQENEFLESEKIRSRTSVKPEAKFLNLNASLGKSIRCLKY